jgi:hypothetical protein
MWSTNPDLIFNNTKAYIWCCFSWIRYKALSCLCRKPVENL